MDLPLVAVGGLLALGFAMLVRGIRRHRRSQLLTALLAMFGPVAARAQAEPRQLVAWGDIAATARALFPDLFRDLDAACGGRFPFSAELIKRSHARWTAEWLAWEREHDVEYKIRADRVEAELARAEADEVSNLRAQLSAIEQEKLQRYQERYEDYVLLGKAIAELE